MTRGFKQGNFYVKRVKARKIRLYGKITASYYKNISELTWGDRQNYELLLDSSIGIEASTDTICHYIKNRGKDEK